MSNNQRYPNGFMMLHRHLGLPDKACAICDYSYDSHGPSATCEACGTQSQCDIFPDVKHPKRMLICEECIDKEITALENAKIDQMNIAKELDARDKMIHVMTPGNYFVSDTPSIKEINDRVNADESIPNNKRAERVCEIVKERILNCQQNILELNNETRARQREEHELQIYLNHKMKEISLEKQTELGLLNINYKQPKAPTKTPSKAPSTKKLDMTKLKEYAAQFNIPIEELRGIAVARSVSIEEAAKIHIRINNALTES